MDDPEIRLSDDGEIEYEYDSTADDFKPKRKPRPYRTVQFPLWFILPIALLLLCGGGALLVNNYQFALCQIHVLCLSVLPSPYARPEVIYSSAPPLDQPRTKITSPAGAVMPTRYPDIPPCGQPEYDAEDDGTIMFRAGASDNAEIFTIHGNGSGLCRLTNNFIEESMPAWSPDRRQIVYSAQRSDGGGNDLFIIDWHATIISNLTQTTTRSESQPKWSPDGKQIAFTSDPDTTTTTDKIDIYVIKVDGTGRRNITNNAGIDQEPIWSPDGRRIAFISDRDDLSNHFSLYVMNADGSHVRQVNFIGTSVFTPAWSPDGQQIAFSNEEGIWIVNPNTGFSQQITRQGGWPVWSPDGKRIVFEADYTLYILDLDHPASPLALTSGLQVIDIAGWR